MFDSWEKIWEKIQKDYLDWVGGGKKLAVQAEAPPPTPTPTPQPTPTPTPPPMIPGQIQQSPVSDAFLRDVVMPITQQYGIPDPVAAGQFAAEGRLGGKNQNNFYNIAAYDSRNGEGNTYSSPQAGVTAYANLLRNDPRYAEVWQDYVNPADFMTRLAPIYASRPDYAQFVMSTPEWRQYSQGGDYAAR